MYEQQIANGVAWLDATYPGWEQNIDVGYLELSSCIRCVLGQLWGHYDRGVCVGGDFGDHERTGIWARQHGFTLSLKDRDNFPTLTAEWRAAIDRRLDATPAPAEDVRELCGVGQ